MPEAVLVLLIAGLAAGFVAGLVGVGGGIIFAPVLFFYFASTGVVGPQLAPLTLGTSLLCTLLTSSVATFHHHRRGAVIPRIALVTGVASAIGVITVSSLITTQPWYSQRVFQLVFSAVLLVVATRMIIAGASADTDGAARATQKPAHARAGAMAGIGTVAGSVSSAVGVGGGVVLVPAFNRILRLPIHSAVGTSSATIIIISLIGVVTYAVLGLGHDAGSHTVGFVDPVTGIALSVPALLTSQLGVITAHKFDRRLLRTGFAVFAIVVAVRLTIRALTAN